MGIKYGKNLVVCTLMMSLFVIPASAQESEFDRELRQTECQAEAFNLYTESNSSCLKNDSRATDECNEIQDFQNRLDCKKEVREILEDCFDRVNAQYDDQVRFCESL